MSGRFLSIVLIEVADVPVMVGFMENDGLLYTTRFMKDPAFTASFTANWSACAPVSLLGLSEAHLTQADQQMAERLVQLYGVRRPDASLVLNGTELTELMTDGIFAEGSYRLSQYLTRINRPVYRCCSVNSRHW